MSNPALKAYKFALQSTRIAFKGDPEVMSAARSRIRLGIIEHKSLVSPQLEEEIEKLNEVSLFLRKNVVQGERKDDGKYELKFHPGTELGDNETIKQGKKDMGSLAGAKGANIRKCS